MAKSDKKYNLHDLYTDNARAVAQAIRYTNPTEQDSTHALAKQIICGTWAQAASEASTRHKNGDIFGGIILGFGIIALVASGAAGPLLLVGGGLMLSGALMSNGTTPASNQFDGKNDFTLSPNARGDKKLFNEAQSRIIIYIHERMSIAPPGP